MKTRIHHTNLTIKEKFNSIHNNEYDYSKFIFTKMHDKSIIVCKEHGEFLQSAHSHLKGQGCPKCSLIKRSNNRRYCNEDFIKKANNVHKNKYDYSKTNYKDSHTKVCIICPEHGEFWQKADSHLSGQGCPHCFEEKRKTIFNYSTSEFIEKAKKTHGDKYDYSKVEYVNSKTKICINCPEHGEYWQIPSQHLSGQGCPKCRKLKSEKRKQTTEMYIEKARKIHGDKYDYHNTEYINVNTKIEITCPIHGTFFQYPYYHLDGCGCQQCAKESKSSKYEDEIINFLIQNNVNVKRGNRKLIYPYELDIFIPSKNIAIEFDGLYWHNEINQHDKKYHLNKTEFCIKQNIQLIHIFEDEWIYKKEIVKSRLKNLLGITENKIYARNCIINELNVKEYRKFLEENHIQGNVNAKYKYGLYYNNELVSLMSFGDMRKNLNGKRADGNFELLRFCNKLNTNVVGGASKLLKYFIKTNNPIKIISYADRRWSNGNLYKQLNFKHIRNSQPSYFYVINDKRYNRFNFRKDKLVRDGFDSNKSEHEIMLERKIYRIYDCGTMVFEWNNN